MQNKKQSGLKIEISDELPKTFDREGFEALGWLPPGETPTTTTLCARVQDAAIKCDTYHVFVSYSPHIDALSVLVRDADHDYNAKTDSWPEPLLNKYVSLTGAGGVAELMDVIDQLQRLGVEV